MDLPQHFGDRLGKAGVHCLPAVSSCLCQDRLKALKLAQNGTFAREEREV